MKKIITAGLLGLFGFNAVADCNSVYCKNVKITGMYVRTDGNTIIATSGDASKLSCETDKAGYITLSGDAKNYNAVYSLLLTVYTTEHPVLVRTNASGKSMVDYVVSDK